MDTLLNDVRYAFRQLRKSPGFTLVAVVTLALGIAVNATMFSLVSAFLLRHPPGRDPQGIAVISSITPEQVYHPDAFPVSAPNYFDWRDANHVFSKVAAADEDRMVSLGGSDHERPEALHSAAVTANYFDLLGVTPQIGRAFSSGEDQPGRDHVAILSHDLWDRRFGSDPSIIGRTIRLNRENWSIIGVMPASFRMLGYVPQLWTPLTLSAADQTPAGRKDRSLTIFARLKSGATIPQAQAELATFAQKAQQQFPEIEKGWGVSVRSYPDFLIYNFGIRTGLIVMMTAVGFVLMIACANVAGLLLARAAGRQKELSIRFSLGARRLDIVRQLLTEGTAIALLGGAAGLLSADWGISFVRANLNFNEAISDLPLSLDRNVLLFVMGISLVSALLSSMIPALKAAGTKIAATLNNESRGSSSGRSQSRIRNVLVTAEIAVALFLLVGAGLLLRGIFLIEHQNLGFEPSHVLTAGLALDNAGYKDAAQQVRFVQDLLPRLEQLPGAQSVAVTSDLPATGPYSVTLRIKGEPDLPANQRHSALDVVATSGYFSTAGIPLLRGRTFTENDDTSAPSVVVVNHELVRRLFPNQDPLGKQIRVDVKGANPQWSEIIGVVGDVKTFSEDTRTDPEVYESFLQRPVSAFSLMVRTSSDPAALASPLRAAVAQMDAELPLSQLMSMSALIERQRYGNPFFTRILGCFAVLALILAAIGIYGLVAYSVGRRTHEIGIRMALGAKSGDVLRMILRESLKMTSIGLGIGLAVAVPLPKVFEAIFEGLRFRDPRLYFVVPAAIIGVALFATYIPARRAGKVDPMVALHYE